MLFVYFKDLHFDLDDKVDGGMNRILTKCETNIDVLVCSIYTHSITKSKKTRCNQLQIIKPYNLEVEQKNRTLHEQQNHQVSSRPKL